MTRDKVWGWIAAVLLLAGASAALAGGGPRNYLMLYDQDAR